MSSECEVENIEEKLRNEISVQKKIIEEKDETISELENKVLRLTALHEKSYRCCEDLRKQVKDLTEQLNEEIKVEIHTDGDTKDTNNDWKDGSNDVSISEIVKSTAEEVVAKQGYVFDESSGLYFDHTSGYYYHPEHGLYYDGKTGIYFYYSHETGSYEFHSQVQLPDSTECYGNEDAEHEVSGASNNVMKCKTVKRKATDEFIGNGHESDSSLEEGEIISSSDSDCMSQNSISDEEELAEHWPPCLRIMLTESPSETVGSLFVVTYPGGFIGSAESCDVHLSNTDKIDPFHVQIKFDDLEKSCVVKNNSVEKEAFLNENLLSATDDESNSWNKLKHGDVIVIGDTILAVHLHIGHVTCDDCEPGQVQATIKAKSTPQDPIHIVSKEEKEKRRRKELKQIKKKYGLQNVDYEANNAVDITTKGYTDKAEHRRITIGSNNPYEKDAPPTSTDTPISSENKGFKMLQKMGWKTGKGLGHIETSIKEPINVEMRSGREGLGSASSTLRSDPVSNRKTERWKKANQRYLEIE